MAHTQAHHHEDHHAHGDHHGPQSPVFPVPSLPLWGGVGAGILCLVFVLTYVLDVSLICRALLIPFIPFVGFVIQIFFGRKLPRWGDWLPISAIFTSFCLALTIGIEMFKAYSPDWGVGGEAAGAVWTWMDFGVQKLKLGVMLDNVTVIIALMVTLTAFLIHLFSVGYMEGEIRYNRFFAYIGLFTSAMLGLVVSDNLLTFFMCWELMGLCSYLLIGFYFEKKSACNASLKAFMTTRVGDTFLFLALVALYQIVGSLRFEDVFAALSSGKLLSAEILGVAALPLIAIGIFLGTVGKSAQFPLQVWLPDAMEGPTPVSALIHAATMVSAGVFLIVRTFPLLEAAQILPIIALIGGVTAFFAAILAIVQNDIKKVLAYSTLSQLGYMVLAIGVGSYYYAFFHLITHACFKALLFMGSGSVIKAMHHEQDMRQMGGLGKKMPVTMLTMGLATCAISGFPFFSGFLSKDGILSQVLYMGFFGEHHWSGFSLFVYRYWAPATGFGAALLTAFYMWRMMFMTFSGKPRNQEKFDHAHENQWPILVPLSVLAVLCLGISFKNTFSGFDHFLPGGMNWFENLVKAPTLVAGSAEGHEEAHHHAHFWASILSLIVAFSGITVSALLYRFGIVKPEMVKRLVPGFVHRTLDNLYYFDFFYIKILIQKILLPWNSLMAWIDRIIVDRWLVDVWAKITHAIDQFTGHFDNLCVDGMVDGAGGLANRLGGALRSLQSGLVQVYLIVAIAGIGFPLIYFLIWR